MAFRVGRAGRLLGRPQDVVVSLWLSARHSRRFWRLPILATPGVRIRRARGARIVIGHRANVGLWTTRFGEITQSRLDRTLIQLGKGATLIIDHGCDIGPGTRIIIGPGATLRLGADSMLAGRTLIVATTSIHLEQGAGVSWDSQVMDSDMHRMMSLDREPGPVHAPIVIGRGAWIGSRVVILKGTRIGPGAIVGAGSVVSGDVPAFTLVAGSPARRLRTGVWLGDHPHDYDPSVDPANAAAVAALIQSGSDQQDGLPVSRSHDLA